MPGKMSFKDYMTCPMCDVEVPMTGEEQVGGEVYCPYCETPLKLLKNKEDELYLVEDF